MNKAYIATILLLLEEATAAKRVAETSASSINKPDIIRIIKMCYGQ